MPGLRGGTSAERAVRPLPQTPARTRIRSFLEKMNIKMNQPRHELKFFISPEVALGVRDFVGEYLDFEEYSVGKREFSYPVHTIYLDSDDWKIYRRTIQGGQDRWKLRLRYYDDRPDSPVFCEVKHQMTDVVVKHRGGVKRAALDSVLDGHLPHPEQLTDGHPRQLMALERFVAMMLEVNARPKLHLSCLREGYETCDGQTRVTLDRHLRVSELSGHLLATRMDHPLMCVDHTVIMVLRFPERYPNWYQDLVRAFDLSERDLGQLTPGTIFCASLQLSPDDLIYNIVL